MSVFLCLVSQQYLTVLLKITLIVQRGWLLFRNPGVLQVPVFPGFGVSFTNDDRIWMGRSCVRNCNYNSSVNDSRQSEFWLLMPSQMLRDIGLLLYIHRIWVRTGFYFVVGGQGQKEFVACYYIQLGSTSCWCPSTVVVLGAVVVFGLYTTCVTELCWRNDSMRCDCRVTSQLTSSTELLWNVLCVCGLVAAVLGVARNPILTQTITLWPQGSHHLTHTHAVRVNVGDG